MNSPEDFYKTKVKLSQNDSFTAKWFFDLEKSLKDMGADSDAQSFDDIKHNLQNPPVLTAGGFAHNCAYVILAGGFSQITAKKLHTKLMEYLRGGGTDFDAMLKIFNNKNKVSAISKIWENRVQYSEQYYALDNTKSRLEFLQKLPHIGPITANHLARNLGEDIVKYDIWMQRLGVMFAGRPELCIHINNGRLHKDIKRACNDMFDKMVAETNLPRGYIDVVLWKAAQQKLIKIN